MTKTYWVEGNEYEVKDEHRSALCEDVTAAVSILRGHRLQILADVADLLCEAHAEEILHREDPSWPVTDPTRQTAREMLHVIARVARRERRGT